MCRLDSQCMSGQHCVLPVANMMQSPAWTCEGTTCAIGRPLLVDGTPRTARTKGRGDWTAAEVRPDVRGLDAGDLAALAAHWRDVAALEHASVASFARFTLELLSLGAPPDLLALAQRAAIDEVEHARVAYALAGAYGDRPVGPGPLDLDRISIDGELESVVRSLILEGCVGETLGAAEALALADGVADPVLSAVHARIAADEQRHAELSWRALAWLLSVGGSRLADHAARCFAEGVAGASADPRAPARVLVHHGLFGAAELGAIRRAALREVVAPCAAALLRRPVREAI
jgi:hypothetical protein